jgi:serpin B
LADARVVELQYAGENLSMLIVLPAGDLRELEKSLTVETLRDWLRNAKHTRLQLALPRFSMSWKQELNDALIAMGMQKAFGRGADFSGMFQERESVWIDFVVQEAFIDVKEQGTEAAAATAVGMQRASEPLPPPTLRVDHPFLFLIREEATGSILFMGRVNDPTQTEGG